MSWAALPRTAGNCSTFSFSFCKPGLWVSGFSSCAPTAVPGARQPKRLSSTPHHRFPRPQPGLSGYWLPWDSSKDGTSGNSLQTGKATKWKEKSTKNSETKCLMAQGKVKSILHFFHWLNSKAVLVLIICCMQNTDFYPHPLFHTQAARRNTFSSLNKLLC